jgi:hypothetical protein
MESIGLRIKHLRDFYYGKNNVKMATNLGTSEANVRNYINGTPPKVDFIINICEKLEINYEWLMTGKGEMLISGPDGKFEEKEKPSKEAPDGLHERYISLLERTIASLEAKINELNKKN